MGTSVVESIGEPKEPLLQLRTKDNVDLVGLSLLLLPWKVLTSRKMEVLRVSLSNSLLIVPNRTMVAMEVLWTMLSSMLRLVLWSLRQIIDMLLRLEDVNMTPLKVSSTLEVSLMSKPTTLNNSWPLLTKESFPLPSKPTKESSNITHLESSPEVDVETNLTME